MVSAAGATHQSRRRTLRLNVGSPIAGIGYELNAIAAVIIGGASLSGGKGSIVGTMVARASSGCSARGCNDSASATT